MRRRSIFIIRLLGLFILVPTLSFAVQLNERCTASILNRVVRVNHNGSFAIPNIPVDQGLFRVRFACRNALSGSSVPLISDYITLVPNSVINIPNVHYGADFPLPLSLRMLVPFGNNNLTALGQKVRLNVQGELSDGTLRDLTPRDNGTTYTSTNARIATVDNGGLVTAVSRGIAVITARNEGVVTTIVINVITPLDSDADGMPDDWETANGLKPNDPSDATQDLDRDGLTNLEEYQHGTNPQVADTDGDGLSDGDEAKKYQTDPLKSDTDGDGLLDGFEVKIGTNPLETDTDSDGITDGAEVKLGLQPLIADSVTTVQGRILDSKGQPASYASASIFGLISTTADSTGFFSIPFAPASLGNIVVAGEMISPTAVLDGSSAPTAPVAGGITNVGVIQLASDSGVVTGTVVDDKNRPAGGVNIIVQASSTIRTTVTDATGHYRVNNQVAGTVFVTALDPKSLLEAQGSGLLVANSLVAINLKLGPSGTLTGRVLKADGVTPVGAGVTVAIDGPMTLSAQTDGLGRFNFDFVMLGNYNINATDTNGNHGTSSANVEFTGETAEAIVSFLPRGTVNVSVQDIDGHLINKANVILQSHSVYGGYFTATTTAAGTVSFAKVFLGSFDLSASAPVSRLGAHGGGSIKKDGDVVNITLNMATTGTIKGTVRQPDATTPVVGASVQLSDGQKSITDGSGQYLLEFVPVSNDLYTIMAANPQNGDLGATQTAVSAQNQVVTADIVMNGFGTVVVTVVDGGNALVPAAKIALTGTGPFGGQNLDTTGNDGKITLQKVVAGTFNIDTVHPSQSLLTGHIAGSVGANKAVNITVQLRAAGSISGKVFLPNGITPAANASVELTGLGRTVTNATGAYSFSTVPVGDYTLIVKDAAGNPRARLAVSLSSQAQDLTQDVTMVGLGTVNGLVHNPDGTSAPSISVNLGSTNAQVGGNFTAQTNVDGRYSISDVPVGGVFLTANGTRSGATLFGQAQGEVKVDGDVETIDIQLVATLIPVPATGVTLYDANDFPWDIGQDASILNGLRRTFAGNFTNISSGLSLDISDTSGHVTRFTGEANATTSLNGRQLALSQTLDTSSNSLAGLKITRKVYVPDDGYFSRYLELVTNTSPQVMTFGMALTSNIRASAQSLPNLISTSSGDAILDVSDPAASDRYVLIDDVQDVDPFITAIGTSFDLNLPALGFVFDGANGADRAAIAGFESIGGFGKLTYGWNNITIQPGQTLAYMHFAVQQTTRASSAASINRLAQVAPEALGTSTFPQLATSFDRLATNVSTLTSQANDVVSNAFNGKPNAFATTLAVLTNLNLEVSSLQAAFDAFAASLVNDPAQVIQNATSLQQEAVKVRDFAASIPNQPFCETGASTCPKVSQALSGSIFVISAAAIQKQAGELSDSASDLLDLANVRNFALLLNGSSAASSLAALPPLHAEFKGRVLASDGATLIPGADVTIHSSDPIYSRTYFTTSDSSGNFDLKSSVLNGGSVSIPVTEAASLQGTHPLTFVQSPIISAAADSLSQTAIQDVVFSNTGIVKGTVRRANGAVVSSGTIGISGTNLLRSGIANINPDGSYAFTGIPAGTYALIVVVPHPQGTGLIGTGTVTITDGSTTTLDVFLRPTGAITGKVINPTGEVAVGLIVNLRAKDFVRSAITDTGGHFTFTDIPVGQFQLDTYDTNSSSAASALLSVVQDQTTIHNLLLNHSGTVTGIITTPTGQPDAGAQVTLTSVSGQTSTTTASDGSYRFSNVTPGNISVLAVDQITGYRGVGSGSFGLAGSTVQIDIKLFANGSITGTVSQAVGGAAVGVPITLTAPSPLNSITLQTDSQGNYRFNNVPVGGFSLSVTTANGDRAQATNQITSNGQTRAVNLKLNGLGNLQVTVLDAASNPVNNVVVTLVGHGTFNGQQTGTTLNGVISFPDFLAGPIDVFAVQNLTNLNGSAHGTNVAGTNTPITVRLQSAGTVVGHVRLSGNPVANVTVTLNSRQTTTDANGGFQFDSIPLGTYTLVGQDANSNIRARQEISVNSNGQVVTQDLDLVAYGTVVGHVSGPDGIAVPSASVFVQSLNPNFGKSFSTTTDNAGAYSVSNVPGGSYTVTATDNVAHSQGASSGSVSTDGQTVTTDIHLVDNSVRLPKTFFDANGFSFDINADGQTRGYSNNTFASQFSFGTEGAMRLVVVANGSPVQFSGVSLASSDLAGHEINIEQKSIAGLNVTRKIFVPQDGYFARYIDIFENPGTDPITVDLKLASNYINSSAEFCCNYSPGQVVATSDQNTALSGSDNWAVIDDPVNGNPLECEFFTICGFRFNHPAAAFGWAGTNAAKRINSASYTPASQFTFQGAGLLNYEWDGVTVPPGSKVAFLHIVTQQTSRESARASIDRLTQLPPEILVGITPDVLAAIQNFNVPADGQSTLSPLLLGGTVTGNVYGFDGTTPIAYGQVKYKGTSPYYGRTYTRNADANGAFNFTDNLTNSSGPSPIAIPILDYSLEATNSYTNQTASAVGSFAPGATTSNQNIVFRNTGDLSGFVKHSNGTAFTNGAVSLSANTGIGILSGSVAMNPDGSYLIPGLSPGAYKAAVYDFNSNSSTDIPGTILILAGKITHQDFMIGIGGVTGDVSSPDGTARASGGTVYFHSQVFGQSCYYGPCSVALDQNGHFTYSALVPGTYSVEYFDNTLNRQFTDLGSFTADLNSPVVFNFKVPTTYPLTVVLKLANGTPFPQQYVYVNDRANQSLNAITDSAGQASFTLFEGPVTIQAFLIAQSPSITEVLSSDPATQMVALVVAPMGTVSGTLKRANGDRVPNTYVYLNRNFSTLVNIATDANGNFLFDHLPLNSEFQLQGSFEYPLNYVQVRKNTPPMTTDGEAIVQDLTLPAVASLNVHVVDSNQQPVSGEYVVLKNSYGRSHFSYSDSSGIAQFNRRATEGGFTVQTLTNRTASGTVQSTDDLATLDITLSLGVSGNINGMVSAADGVTPIPSVFVRINDTATGEGISGTYTDALGNYSISVVSGGAGFDVDVSVFPSVHKIVHAQFSGNGDTQTVNITMPAGILKGKVFFHDGLTAVPYPNVYATALASGNTNYVWSNDDLGNYLVLTPEVGSFTVTAQDYNTGLSSSVPATLSSLDVPVSTDVQLPGSGTVILTVHNSDGHSLSNGYVTISSGGGGFQRTQYICADECGSEALTFEGVPTGKVSALVHDSNSLNTETFSVGDLVNDGDTLTKDLTMSPLVTISGIISDFMGSLAAFADVRVQDSPAIGTGEFDAPTKYTKSGADGAYSLTGFVAGTATVTATDANRIFGGSNSAPVDPNVSLNTSINVQFSGFARSDEAGLLDSVNGFRYALDCSGQLNSNTGSVAGDVFGIGNALQLNLDGNYFRRACPFVASMNFQQVALTNSVLDGLSVTRKAYVPLAGGFIRYLDEFTNNGSSDVNVNVSYLNFLYSGVNTNIVVTPSSTSNTYSVVDSTFNNANPFTGAFGFIMAGANSNSAPVQTEFIKGNSQLKYRYVLAVPAGQTVILMQYLIQGTRTGAPAVQTEAQALTTLTDTNALTGMSSAEKAQVINFKIPQ